MDPEGIVAFFPSPDLLQGHFIMWTSEHRNVIVMFMSFAFLFAPADIIQAQSQNRFGADARQIMEASIAATRRDWKARLHYTYTERDGNRHVDSAGRVTSEDVAGNPGPADRAITQAGGREHVDCAGSPEGFRFSACRGRNRQWQAVVCSSGDAAPRLSCPGKVRQYVFQSRG